MHIMNKKKTMQTHQQYHQISVHLHRSHSLWLQLYCLTSKGFPGASSNCANNLFGGMLVHAKWGIGKFEGKITLSTPRKTNSQEKAGMRTNYREYKKDESILLMEWMESRPCVCGGELATHVSKVTASFPLTLHYYSPLLLIVLYFFYICQSPSLA